MIYTSKQYFGRKIEANDRLKNMAEKKYDEMTSLESKVKDTLAGAFKTGIQQVKQSKEHRS